MSNCAVCWERAAGARRHEVRADDGLARARRGDEDADVVRQKCTGGLILDLGELPLESAVDRLAAVPLIVDFERCAVWPEEMTLPPSCPHSHRESPHRGCSRREQPANSVGVSPCRLVWGRRVVVAPPVVDDRLRVRQAGKQVFVEALIAQPADEALGEAILQGLAGRN